MLPEDVQNSLKTEFADLALPIESVPDKDTSFILLTVLGNSETEDIVFEELHHFFPGQSTRLRHFLSRVKEHVPKSQTPEQEVAYDLTDTSLRLSSKQSIYLEAHEALSVFPKPEQEQLLSWLDSIDSGSTQGSPDKPLVVLTIPETSASALALFDHFQQHFPNQKQRSLRFLRQWKERDTDDTQAETIADDLKSSGETIEEPTVIEEPTIISEAEAAPAMETDSAADAADAQLALLAELGIGADAIDIPAPAGESESFAGKIKKELRSVYRNTMGKIKGNQFARTILQKSAVWVVPIMVFVGIVAIDAIIDFYILLSKGRDVSSFFLLERSTSLQTLSGLNRSMNQILGACMFALVIALPLTAALYTPRLVTTLTNNRITVLTLTLLIINNGNTIWTIHSFNYVYLPYFQVYTCMFLFFVCIIIAIPYFLNILQHLDPYFIIKRLGDEVHSYIKHITEAPSYRDIDRQKIQERLTIINHMILKATDRMDRELAIEGIRTQKRMLDFYAPLKSKMPQQWMEVDYFTFIGMSTIGVEVVNQKHIWLELYILKSMLKVFTVSLQRLPDLASAVSELVYQIGMKFMNTNDHEVMDLCMRFFNTFLSEAIEERDITSIHSVLYQYRLFAEMTLSVGSETICAAAESFRKYSQVAANRKLSQVRDTALYDLVHLAYVAKTYAGDEEAFQALCNAILSYEIDEYPEEASSIAKAKLIFAGFLISIQEQTVLDRLWAQIDKIPEEHLKRYHNDLLVFNEKIQPEITDRFISSAYLREEQAPSVEEVFRLLGVTEE